MSSHESLSSPPGFHLPQLNGLADGIAADEAEPTVIELTYHDTRDLRISNGLQNAIQREVEHSMIAAVRNGMDRRGDLETGQVH